MTWRDVQLTLVGLNRRNEVIERREWETARGIAYTIHTHNVAMKDRAELYDFWPLRWDPTVKQRNRMREKEAMKLIAEAKKMGAL